MAADHFEYDPVKSIAKANGMRSRVRIRSMKTVVKRRNGEHVPAWQHRIAERVEL